ncbi:Gustatory receptor 94, partial [Hyalella azteca]
NCWSSNSCLLFCLAVTRITRTYALIHTTQLHKNQGSKFVGLKIGNYLVFFLFFAVALVLTFSFNFFVGVLRGKFEMISVALSECVTLLDKLDTETVTCSTNVACVRSHVAVWNNNVGANRRAPNTPGKFLKEIEHQLLLIDRAIELITNVYSWVLIFLSSWYLTDFLFSIYLMVVQIESGNNEIETYSVIAIEALLFLFLMHNPADNLSNSEEAFIAHLRMLIYCLPDHSHSMPHTGLVLAVQRPRKLTLGNFGNVGRGSFLNTLAFMFSYLVVVIQFHIDAQHPASTTSPANASCVVTN